MEKKTATQVNMAQKHKEDAIANYVADIVIDINKEVPLTVEQVRVISRVITGPISKLFDEIENVKG